MRHIIPKYKPRRAFEPTPVRGLFGRSKGRSNSRRALMMGNYHDAQRTNSVPRFVWVLIMVITAMLLVQSALRAPYFRIDGVQVLGLAYLPADEIYRFIDEELQRRRLIFFKNNNYFIISLGPMKKRLEQRYYLNVVSMSKDFPDGLKLHIDEKVSAFVLQMPDRYIQMDGTGAWLGAVERPGSSQTVIADERIQTGAAIDITYLERATQIKEAWDKSVSQQIKIQKFHLTDDPHTIQVSTDKAFRVYFAPEKDIPQQVGRLAAFLRETNIEQPREYIDLRFDENLYLR